MAAERAAAWASLTECIRSILMRSWAGHGSADFYADAFYTEPGCAPVYSVGLLYPTDPVAIASGKPMLQRSDALTTAWRAVHEAYARAGDPLYLARIAFAHDDGGWRVVREVCQSLAERHALVVARRALEPALLRALVLLAPDADWQRIHVVWDRARDAPLPFYGYVRSALTGADTRLVAQTEPLVQVYEASRQLYAERGFELLTYRCTVDGGPGAATLAKIHDSYG
jgi:hypothetical protein